MNPDINGSIARSWKTRFWVPPDTMQWETYAITNDAKRKGKKNELGSNQARSFNTSLQETRGIEDHGNQFLTACLAHLIFI